MELLVLSHKPCWPSAEAASGFATDGGFPFQMGALSQLFEKTTLLLPHRRSPAPKGLTPLAGHELRVSPLPEPPGLGLRRKLALLIWFPRHLPNLWRQVGHADAVHAAVPGDLGTLGLLLALIRKKPLLVRHCGTWGNRTTLADRFLAWLLPRIAGGRNVVLATGGDAAPPEPRYPAVQWIFSTSLSRKEMNEIPISSPWQPGRPLRLVTVGRLSRGKNTRACLSALSLIRNHYPEAHLEVVGAGPCRAELESMAKDLDLLDAVTFHGNLSHPGVLDALCRSHIFLFPTRTAEGFPKAALEALACGLPVVAPPVSVLRLLLEEGCGALLEAPEGKQVANAVLSLTADPERLGRISSQARKTAQRYTLEGWQDLIGESLFAAWKWRRKAQLTTEDLQQEAEHV
ncbi:MAG: glycosyltransferase [Deltaproteobacteria bacterium]|nr:glycosyltransferase [Deltaproteobacteria bacterium]